MADRQHLVLIHGHLCSPGMWRRQVAQLSASYDLHVPSIGAHDTIRGFSKALLTGLPDSFSVAGFSLGGYIAMDMIRIAPQRIRRVALLDTVSHVDTPEQQARRDANLRRAAEGGFANIRSEFCAALSGPVIARDAALREEIDAMVIAHGADTYRIQQTAMRNRESFEMLLKQLTCPLLVAYGEEDALTPPAAHHAMAVRAPHAALVGIPGAAHMSPVEQPIAVGCLLDMWMQLPSPHASATGAA